MNNSSKTRLLSFHFVLTIFILAVSCSNPNMDLSINATEAQEYVGDISRIWAGSETARYYTGQIISNWYGQTDVVFEGNLIEYTSVRQSILDYVLDLPSNNALMHQNYGDIDYDGSKQYVEFSSYTSVDTGEVLAYEIRIFYGDFWDTFNTDLWYAKSVLFNPSFTKNFETDEVLDFQ